MQTDKLIHWMVSWNTSKNNPMSYSNRTIQSNINNTHNTHDEQQPKIDKPERRQEHTQTTINNTGEDKIIKYSKVKTV